ncbi:positive regulator of sigma(E), RseC/MucC [Fervidobacterium changbaicum]|uniref:Fis family transcriptional regulator n=1 Tax=Fervidobacterium changbaicum TaxID=310769 RepID=A0ABX5QTJ8_9BACT|nr:SoxR reducing system RseC family protein [Fervidobacterium changbaicum]QAV33709.1 Fis family transcriptional regulator [Fervidobacterium changbaicum]SDH40930.1 positive regulator of sigma(E), RseC/MucC [Fervidobacterium changbaicum]
MREVMTVTSVDENYIYVSLSVDPGTCASCALSGACSIKSESAKKGVFKISKKNINENLLPVMPGDIVVVDFKYNTAILSMIVYGIPLTGFIFGALIGYLLKLSDILSFVLALVFAGIGTVITRLYDKKYKIEIVDVKRNTSGINLGHIS